MPISKEQSSGKTELVVANCNGILSAGRDISAQMQTFFDSGIDIAVLGDQAIARKSARQALEAGQPVIRPLNFPLGAPGEGAWKFATSNGDLWIVSLYTGSYRNPVDDPGDVLKRFLEAKPPFWACVVDFFGPNIQLKQALAWSFGTKYRNVHFLGTGLGVGTIDARVCSGQAFVSDIGVVGPQGAIAGVQPKVWLQNRYERWSLSDGSPNAVLQGSALELTLDQDGQALEVRRLSLGENSP